MSGVFQGNAAETRCPIAELAVCPAPMDNPIPDVKNMLTWSQSERIVGFRNTYRSYSGDVFKAGNAEPLPVSYRNLDDVGYIYQGKHYGLQEYLRRNNVTAMMVIKDGHIVWDYYGNGNTKTTLWTSRSVGKSVVSTLLGIALKEGKISSLADPLSKYNPDVKGTVWQKVTLGQLLQHVSGVTWNEDYTNPHSDFAKLTQCEAGNNTYDCVSKLVLDPNRTAYAQPGEIWSYSSAGAWLLGDTLEKATGKSLAQYLQEKIWQPAGMVQDGVWQSYAKNKHDVGAHGVNATLQDWGKFGLFVMTGGELPDGTKCLPNNWIEQSRDWTKAKYSVSSNYPQVSTVFSGGTTVYPRLLKMSGQREGYRRIPCGPKGSLVS
ncbi:Beta-lactamase [Izhakiella capsodis]|uniref:Beta-lactamase n=1 Tax=Izhakiella capsodis TaxID=1367852 RepID=A0A1I4VRS1_9GAMM|nr:Beta-lactamase [Izhakiella capsodis]